MAKDMTLVKELIVIEGPASSRAKAILSWTEILVSVLSQALIIMKMSSMPTERTRNKAATTIDWNFIFKKDIIPRAARMERRGIRHPIKDSHGLL